MTSPSCAAVPRRPGSIRRTSHVDMIPAPAGLVLDGAARDLVTSTAGATEVGRASVRAEVAATGRLATLTIDPVTGPVDALVGLAVGKGFRDAVHRALADDVATSSPLALLLDDLPVATLISGYALLYRGVVPTTTAHGVRADVCSGWRTGGTMMTSIHAGLGIPVSFGPVAPPIEADRATDPLGWHDLPPLTVGAMRRRRLVDVGVGEDAEWEIVAMFRDTHVDPDGTEAVLHEYTVSAAVDPVTAVLTACHAIPRVLPYVECPVAAASSVRLVGRPVEAVRDVVRAELRGISTCTHLNDLLRSLGDVAALMATIHP